MEIGILLGGKIGVITVISIALGGPVIAFFTRKVQKSYFNPRFNHPVYPEM